MSVYNERDFQYLQPKLDELMAWDIGNEFESVPPTQQQTNDLLNIAELRETIRLAEHQLIQHKLQLCRLLFEHYRSLNSFLNEAEKTVDVTPRFDGPVSCPHSSDSSVSDFLPDFTTHVVRENDILTVYCGNVHASVTLD
ncbi:hypothetical protein F5878DRAFT_665050 [Lentinula raphanica]|uniref:Uncharacterized protein n=1 Tax=Lentinula raphanica TaxID=153919 RepID=A0AA38U836_9AGAR|nr:hypothetical protein F5878DRAFT_665050 [Lentinula raphanica]